MANSGDLFANNSPISFSDFPDDVQLCILSFLSPADLSSFSCTSKLFASLCRADSKLWYALCDRRWGSKTEINKWGNGQVGFKHLYRTLGEYEKLIGFWRRVGDSGDNLIDNSNSIDYSALVFFEWGPSSITGSRVSPSKCGGYNVVKTPFIWISLSSEGGVLIYLDPNCRVVSDTLDCSDRDLIPLNVNFVSRGHVFLEESREFNGGVNAWQMNGNFPNSGGEEFNGNEIENVVEGEIGSPPERLMSEMYQYFANRTSPGAGGERAWRRQRRRERERRGRRRWDPQHLVKIVQSSPSPSHPLQGLWKGICEDMTLVFYLVSYDDMGGIVCRRVNDSLNPPSGGPPVFWTSSATFIESPLSPEENLLYSTRVHLNPDTDTDTDTSANDVLEILDSRDEQVVCRMMYINSSYDLVIPDLAETAANPRHVQGRIWVYSDGTFGFGFLRNNFIIDMKRLTQDYQLLHVIEQEGTGL